jgi:hypothetical protein
MEHLAEKDFDGFWQDRLDPIALRQAVRHLAGGCEACRQRLAATAPRDTPFWRLERLSDDAYDAPIDRALRSVRKLLPKLNQDKERRDRGLALLRERGGWTGITYPERRAFQGLWPHIEILLQRSFDARYSKPREMLELAQFAQAVSERLDGSRRRATASATAAVRRMPSKPFARASHSSIWRATLTWARSPSRTFSTR